MTDTTLQIQLTKSELSIESLPYIVDKNVYVFPLKMTLMSNLNLEDPTAAEDPNFGYPANLFVLQLSGTGFDPDQGDMFVRMANLTDVYELPTEDTIDSMNSRTETLQTPYYRTNEVQLACASEDEMNIVYQTAQSLITSFVNNYNSQSDISNTETTII